MNNKGLKKALNRRLNRDCTEDYTDCFFFLLNIVFYTNLTILVKQKCDCCPLCVITRYSVVIKCERVEIQEVLNKNCLRKKKKQL